MSATVLHVRTVRCIHPQYSLHVCNFLLNVGVSHQENYWLRLAPDKQKGTHLRLV